MNNKYWFSNLIQRKCPLCGSNDRQIISKKMQHDLNLNTVICKNCSFVFTNPIPLKKIYDGFYYEAYYKYYGDIAGRNSEKEKSNIPREIAKKINWIQKICPLAEKRLLEVGPGNGLFLWWAKQKGAEVLGIEPSTGFSGILEQENLPHITNTVENIDYSLIGKFDIVTMFHSLEHFSDPNEIFSILGNLLFDDGLIVIEVPNILKPFRSLDSFFLRYVHPSNFSVTTLSLFLKKHGFRILFIDEGNNDWRHPQNIFIIARKSKLVVEPIKIKNDWKPIYRHLIKYRAKWLLWYQWLWLSMEIFKKSKSSIKKMILERE